MNIFLPLIAAVVHASSLVFDKAILSAHGVDYRAYLRFGYPLYFAAMVVLFLVFSPPLSLELFRGELLALFLASAAVMLVLSITYYRALDDDGLGEVQTLDLLHYVPVVLVSAFLFSDERNMFVVGAALVAAGAVFWSHWEHHRVAIAKRTLAFVAWAAVAAPIEAALAKTLLMYWHPVAFATVRAGVIAVAIFLLFSKHAQRLPAQAMRLSVFPAALSAIAVTLYFYSFQRLGIVYTVLLFSIQPLLVYAAAVLFLKEQFHWKKAVAFVIVLGAITAAQILS
ncbi:DMT family transporter [Candidatus Azambacteria bacterium]|nr:DMT family transporter [Candidatus Azambacteria bacterium]